MNHITSFQKLLWSLIKECRKMQRSCYPLLWNADNWGFIQMSGGYLRLFHRGPWVSISEIQEQWFIGKLSGDLNTQGDRFIQGLYVKVWLCHVLGLHGWGVEKKASESPPKLSTSIGLRLELVYKLDAAEHFTARITLLSPTSPGLLEFGIVSLILLSMLLELNS